MASLHRLFLVALLFSLLLSSVVRAAAASSVEEDEDDEPVVDEKFDSTEDEGPLSGVRSVVTFAESVTEGAPHFPAGEKAELYISMANIPENSPYDILGVSAGITHLTTRGIGQNFTFMPSKRTVRGGETITLHYSFTPDIMTTPQNYNLVVRVVFSMDGAQPFLATAYNGTVTIDDPIATDYRAIFSTIFILASCGVVVYLFVLPRFGIGSSAVFAPTAAQTAAAAARKRAQEKIAKDSIAEAAPKTENGVDSSYISAEHLRYKEQILKMKAARSNSGKQ